MKKYILPAIIIFLLFFIAFRSNMRNEPKLLAERVFSAEKTRDGMMRINANGHSYDIDVFEFPGIEGKLPDANMKYEDAKNACESAGKRLCTNAEWMEACRGAVLNKYSYGDSFNKTLCNNLHFDRRLKPSGRFESCATPDGIHDMAGNLWEWVLQSETSALQAKGGSFRDGEISQRCEFIFKIFPSQTAHLSMDNFGTRCCRDVPDVE